MLDRICAMGYFEERTSANNIRVDMEVGHDPENKSTRGPEISPMDMLGTIILGKRTVLETGFRINLFGT